MYRILNINDIKEYAHYFNEIDELKINKFIKNDDRLRAIGSIILQKDYIREIFDKMAFKDIVIQYTEFGKPYYNLLHYNVSHDKDLVIIAYSGNNKPIGVDIMKNTRVNIHQFSDSFTMREKSQLSHDNFFSYWCAKEAFLKAIGIGLTVEMSSIEYENGTIKHNGRSYGVTFIDIPDYVCAYVVVVD
jgi:4'-phosphopantetheinyl transferase